MNSSWVTSILLFKECITAKAVQDDQFIFFRLKNEINHSLYCYINKHTYRFYEFKIKNAFRSNVSERGKFRFESSLKWFISLARSKPFSSLLLEEDFGKMPILFTFAVCLLDKHYDHYKAFRILIEPRTYW